MSYISVNGKSERSFIVYLQCIDIPRKLCVSHGAKIKPETFPLSAHLVFSFVQAYLPPFSRLILKHASINTEHIVEVIFTTYSSIISAEDHTPLLPEDDHQELGALPEDLQYNHLI